MALTIGELVGFIRADDEGFVRGLSNAQLRLRGLQRDTDGRLRDIRGQFVSEGEAAGRGLGDGIRAHAELAVPAVKRVGLAVGALGAGVPAVTAVSAGLMGLAAGAAAAGIAVKAFTLASQEQWEGVQDVATLAEEAQKAAASGAADAAEKQKAYTDALAQLPPATQQTAKSFIGLKSDFSAWSDSLSGTTMPVFTKGIEILRDLLPMLTPFVKEAAKAFSGFLDEVAAGVKSAGFKEWAADMAKASGPALKNFLRVIKNLAVGFGGLLQAFLPASDGVTGGLVEMTGAFADWATGLNDSQGFQTFLNLAQEGGETLGTLAGTALEVLAALSPLIGVTAQVALILAELINMVPPDVLLGIATGFVAINLAVKAYGLYTRLAAAATRAWAMATALWSTIMMANPVGLIIAAIVALVAIIVIAWQRSETFRNIVKAVWAAVQSAIGTAVDWILDKVGWFAQLPGKMSRWFGQAKDWAVRKFSELVSWVRGLPGRASSALAGLSGALQRRAAEAGRALVSATRSKISEAVGWVRGLPGRARSALGNLGGILRSAGQALIRGFISGIRSMIGSVRDAASSVVSAARDFFPFSPAKEGPFSGSGYTTHSGRALIQGFQRGISDQLPKLRAQMGGVMGGLPPLALPGHARAGVSTLPGAAVAGAVPHERRIVLEVQNGAGGRVEALLTHIIRETVAVKGGGDVQAAFGRKR